MKRKYIILIALGISACSEPQSEQEKEFVKFCYYNSNTMISKDSCSCIYKDLREKYSESEMTKLLKDDYPREQLHLIKEKFQRNLLNSLQKCK